MSTNDFRERFEGRMVQDSRLGHEKIPGAILYLFVMMAFGIQIHWVVGNREDH